MGSVGPRPGLGRAFLLQRWRASSTAGNNDLDTAYTSAVGHVNTVPVSPSAHGVQSQAVDPSSHQLWLTAHLQTWKFLGKATGFVLIAISVYFWIRWVLLERMKTLQDLKGRENQRKFDVAITSQQHPPVDGSGTHLSDYKGGSAKEDRLFTTKENQGLGTSQSWTRSHAGRGAVSSPSLNSPKISNTAEAGPTQDGALALGWWKSLPCIHYINLGSQYGLLPKVHLASNSEALHLLAFEDAADAEFVASVMKVNLWQALGSGSSGAYPSIKHRVVAAAPLFLEDVAQLQGAQLEVVPRDRLTHRQHLSDEDLTVLLVEAVRSSHSTDGPPPSPSSSILARTLQQAEVVSPAEQSPPELGPMPVKDTLDNQLDHTNGYNHSDSMKKERPFSKEERPMSSLDVHFNLTSVVTEAVEPTTTSKPEPSGNDTTSKGAGRPLPDVDKGHVNGFAHPHAPNEVLVDDKGIKSGPHVTSKGPDNAIGMPESEMGGTMNREWSRTDPLMSESVEVTQSFQVDPGSQEASAAGPGLSGYGDQIHGGRHPQGLDLNRDVTSGESDPTAGSTQLVSSGTDSFAGHSLTDAAIAEALDVFSAPSCSVSDVAQLRQQVLEEYYCLVGQPGADEEEDAAGQLNGAAREGQGTTELYSSSVGATGLPHATASYPVSSPDKTLTAAAGQDKTNVVTGPSVDKGFQLNTKVNEELGVHGAAGGNGARRRSVDLLEDRAAGGTIVDMLEDQLKRSEHKASPLGEGSRTAQTMPSEFASSDPLSTVFQLQSELTKLRDQVDDTLGKLDPTQLRSLAGPDGTVDRNAGLKVISELQGLRDQLLGVKEQMEIVAVNQGIPLPEVPTIAPLVEKRLEAMDGLTGAKAVSKQQLVEGAEPAVASRSADLDAPETTGAGDQRQGLGDRGRDGVPEALVDRGLPPPLVSPTVVPAADQHDKSRRWGMWGRNERITSAGTTLLGRPRAKKDEEEVDRYSPSTRESTSGNDVAKTPGSPVRTSSQVSRAPDPQPHHSSVPSASTSTEVADGASAADADADDDGSVVISKRIGRSQPRGPSMEPHEKQSLMTEAMRHAAEEMKGEAHEEEDLGKDGAIASSFGQEPWWKKQYQVLFLPNLRYADGSVGFFQLDVSLNPNKKDVRVVTFEDRHDCMHCLAVMKQWPEYNWCEMFMGMMPTNKLEEELLQAYQTSRARNEGASPPQGLVVFRRGRLQVKVGMSLEELTQLVVYQAAAQVSLEKIGFPFA